MKKKTNIKGVDPEFLKKREASMVRRHRYVIYLNDNELSAIDNYCRQFRVRTKSALFREAVMEKVISELEENHPTLF